MSTKREPPTAADVIVSGLSPILIMGTVGSLVFFLAEVLYSGRYADRLLYTLFFFVIGAVLVGRIAVVVDRKRAFVYGAILALVTLITLNVWVEYPADSPVANIKDLINILLVGVVLWCSNKLVWDCTFIDEMRTGSGKGLLAAAGWEKLPNARPDVVDDVVEDETQYPDGVSGWYARFGQWKKARAKKPHTPGLTVVYFSLAALPVFGLGQSLIPSDEVTRRAFGFRLAAAYVFCTLSLLVTTSFLGLRRYLRQRKIQMPIVMSAKWLGLGVVLIVAFLVVGALLPRPYSESPAWDIQRVTSTERNASQYAQNRDSSGKGDGRAGEKTTKGDGKATAKGGDPGGKGKSGESKTGSGEKDGKNGSGDSKEGKNAGKSKGDSKEGKNGDDKENKSGSNSEEEKSGSKSNEKSRDSSSSPSSNSGLSKIASVLKWIVFAVLAIIVIVYLFRNGLSFLANFMPWARNLLAAFDAWWKSLFGIKERKPGGSSGSASESEAVEIATGVPFATFSDPFRDGTSKGRSVEELTRYSFQALEAWARDRGVDRRDDETPIEFANRLGSEFEWLTDDARKLAVLVARMAYAQGPLPNGSRKTLEEFWDRIASGAAVAT